MPFIDGRVTAPVTSSPTIIAGSSSLPAQAHTESDQDAARLQLVKNYADTVLKDAADRYHPEDPSPLLAGGINVDTKEQLKWIFPESVSKSTKRWPPHWSRPLLSCRWAK